MAYEAVIGLEVHAELSTESKMFCTCSASFFGREPNTQVCPVCMGYPGVLPVVNERAIEYAVRVGLAVGCQISPFSRFDRKNYCYPDLPKGYQISQYDLPICHDGAIEIDMDGERRRIRIRRVHLEEDTAKGSHVGGSSLVDFNRSGVPLLEIVTEPDIRSGEEARQFLVELRKTLRYLGVSSADMEKGAMRCEPNVSVRKLGAAKMGVKAEIKNLNSFRVVRLAIEYEIARQIQVLESGGRVEQVTMGWNEREGKTIVQRSKEHANDYRYFPEPDLPPLQLHAAYVAEIRSRLPELPEAKSARFVADYELRPYDAALLASDPTVADYYEACVSAAGARGVNARTVGNWVSGELFRLLNEAGLEVADAPVSPGSLADLLGQVEDGVIHANAGKRVLAEMFRTGRAPKALIDDLGLAQVDDGDAIQELIRQAIDDNPGPLQQYLAGKDSVSGFFVGQVMRASRGTANPHTVRELLKLELDRLRAEQESE